MKVLFFVSEDWYFCSHRLSLAKALKKEGFEIIVCTNISSHGDEIRNCGFKLISVPFYRAFNPWKDVKTLVCLFLTFKDECPDITHNIALKPVILGSLISLLCRVPRVVNTLTGLGYVFTSRSIFARTLRLFTEPVLRILLKRKNCWIIMQNPDDAELLIKKKILTRDRISLIRGSGVDLNKFKPSPAATGKPLVMMASRLLKDKGVVEFVYAAELIKNSGTDAKFVLVGTIDEKNPSAIDYAQLKEWESKDIIEWWGHRDNMHEVLAEAHIICLPSYREGLPKVLLEAAAVARPIVATDVPGCREIVTHRENGLLVPVRDHIALAEAIKQLINDKKLQDIMGNKGRKMVEKEFSNEIVNRQTIALYNKILQEAA